MAGVTYFRQWDDFSINEGYDYPMKFPWVTACVTFAKPGLLYLSFAFRDHIWRWDRRFE